MSAAAFRAVCVWTVVVDCRVSDSKLGSCVYAAHEGEVVLSNCQVWGAAKFCVSACLSTATLADCELRSAGEAAVNGLLGARVELRGLTRVLAAEGSGGGEKVALKVTDIGSAVRVESSVVVQGREEECGGGSVEHL